MTSSVNSRISPKRYESLISEIEEEDRNIKSDLYELSIYDHTIHISPGKTIEDEEIKDLVYCYVYVVKNDKVVQKLGVYEKFTKEKEDFFDLSTFEKGTLCVFEKYETNPSIFLDFKTDLVKEPKEKKPKKKSKAQAQAEQAAAEQAQEIMPEAVEAEAVEVDLNAETPKAKVEPVEVDLNAVSNPEVDLNAPETFKQEPVEVDLNAESPKATAEAKVETKSETKPKPPTLLDVNELEKDLSLEKPKKSKSKIKLKAEKAEKAEPKVETKAKDESPKAEPKAETKAKVETPKRKTGTKKSKPILVDGEIPGTKFG